LAEQIHLDGVTRDLLTRTKWTRPSQSYVLTAKWLKMYGHQTRFSAMPKNQ